jgi:hypothetical protein
MASSYKHYSTDRIVLLGLPFESEEKYRAMYDLGFWQGCRRLSHDYMYSIIKDYFRNSEGFANINCRKQEYVSERFVYFFLMRNYTTTTLTQIAKVKGRTYDHSAIIHACHDVAQKLSYKDVIYTEIVGKFVEHAKQELYLLK